jgi:hypothetical protein
VEAAFDAAGTVSVYQEINCASRAVASALKVERGGLVFILKLKG